MSHITTHVLDSTFGRPAAGLPVQLESEDGELLDNAVTDADGRVSEIGPPKLEPRVYRLVFDVGTYFAATGQDSFYPRVVIDFEVKDAPHYHVPLLLSPFAYSTYRGS
ncbi:MAG: 5-hydroxyisourate hydrolase [Glaciihabitans sp.]|nr:5-hydroxyisourate hydrolase [Glaciihabitans sp.]